MPQDGQVQVLPPREAYLPSGRFEPPRMLDCLVGHIEQAAADGFAGLRLVGDMAWALDGPAGVEQLAGYEAHVNQLYLDGPASGICLYDRRDFRADLLRQVAQAHPAMTGPGVEAGWAPLLRIRRTVDPYGLRLTGEADLSNRRALAAALDQQPAPATPILIDVYTDAGTAALIGRLAVQAPAGVHVTGVRAEIETVLDRVGVGQLSRVRLTRATGGAGSSETEMVA